MINNYQGKKFFTILNEDVGSEAYHDKYVKWLEEQVETLESQLLRKDFKPGDMK